MTEKRLHVPSQFAVDVFIEEIPEDESCDGKNVKVTGWLLDDSMHDDIVKIQCITSKIGLMEPLHILCIDTRNIDENLRRQKDALHHFCGELSYDNGIPVLLAQVVTSCDHLDIDEYVKTIKARRHYFQSCMK